MEAVRVHAPAMRIMGSEPFASSSEIVLGCGIEHQDGGDGIEGVGGELDIEAFAGLCEFERFVSRVR